jgi:hypothetical protein
MAGSTVGDVDPEVSAAGAAWVAAVAAVVFGGTGFVLAVMAYVRAGRANDAAARSNAIAEGANELAEESNRIAQSSVDVVVAADARAIEQHDVRWDRAWADAGVFRLTNIGQHTAHDVVAQVRVLADRKHVGERAIAESAKVEPGEHIDVECAGIRALHGAMEIEYAAHVGVSGIRLVPFQPEVEERVFWRSPLGTPHDHIHSGRVWFDAREVHRRRARSVEG